MTFLSYKNETSEYGAEVFVDQKTHLVCLEVQDGQERIGIRLVAVDLDGAAEQRLGQNDIGQLGQVKQLAVNVEQLAQQRLEPVEVDGGLRVEPLKLDVHHVHVLHG